MNFEKEAKAISEDIITWRRQLHRIPEVGNILPATGAYVQEKLREMGVPFFVMKDSSGICACVGKNKQGGAVAIRADMDAVPIIEETGLPYASATQGIMHACGHDCHTAIALGVAKLLKKHEEDLPGMVKFFFQPGEEVFSGAKSMLASGVLESPSVGAVLVLHILSNYGPPGSLVVRRGTFTASADSFLIKVNGIGGHAAFPDLCTNPILIVTDILEALQNNIVDAGTCAIVGISGIQAGSDSFNTIPSCAELRGTIRTLNNAVRVEIWKQIKETVASIAANYGVVAETNIIKGVPPLVNDDAILDTVTEYYNTLEGRQKTIMLPSPMMAGDDAAFIFDKVPGAYFGLEVAIPHSDGKKYPLHSSKFNADEDVLYLGVACLAASAVALMRH